MRISHGSPHLKKVAQRWHDLAEQRLAYYAEMYRSGRWKHYYTQEGFAVRMLDVIEDAKKWRQLAGRQQTPMSEQTARSEILCSDVPRNESMRDAAVRPAA